MDSNKHCIKILFVLAALLTIGCSDNSEEQRRVSPPHLVFLPRTCEYAFIYDTEDKNTFVFEVTGVPEGFFFWDEQFTTSHNEYIEKQIRNYYLASGRYYSFIPIGVQYSDVECESLTISGSVQLFGRLAGSDLSDCFEFVEYEATPWFVFNNERVLLGKLTTGLSIKDYLDSKPLIFNSAWLRLKETPPEVTEDEPLEVEFTVTVELEGGKTLSATTAVTLEK